MNGRGDGDARWHDVPDGLGDGYGFGRGNGRGHGRDYGFRNGNGGGYGYGAGHGNGRGLRVYELCPMTMIAVDALITNTYRS